MMPAFAWLNTAEGRTIHFFVFHFAYVLHTIEPQAIERVGSPKFGGPTLFYSSLSLAFNPGCFFELG
jgi:hypothetical protein